MGNLTCASVGWGKLNRKCQVSNHFFSGTEVANSFKTLVDEIEEFKGRDIAFASDWLTKKVEVSSRSAHNFAAICRDDIRRVCMES